MQMRQESNSPDADTKARLLRIWWGMGMGMGMSLAISWIRDTFSA